MLVGVTVMPEYFQSESVNGVLDSLEGLAGVTAVTTSPYVMAPADRRTGFREPPIDAGAGKVRLLDRTLWGKRELWARTAPSFQPNLDLYRGLRYQPPAADDLTREQGPLVEEFIRNAQSRGLKVFLQVQAAIPPGYRVQFGQAEPDDCPRLPDGSIPKRRLSANGSLASPHIRDYALALLRDLCRQYPTVDGLRLDWPEYPLGPGLWPGRPLQLGPFGQALHHALAHDASILRGTPEPGQSGSVPAASGESPGPPLRYRPGAGSGAAGGLPLSFPGRTPSGGGSCPAPQDRPGPTGGRQHPGLHPGARLRSHPGFSKPPSDRPESQPARFLDQPLRPPERREAGHRGGSGAGETREKRVIHEVTRRTDKSYPQRKTTNHEWTRMNTNK